MDIYLGALLEMAVPSIEVAVVALDADMTKAKFTSVECVVIVIELHKGHSALAVLEQTAFKERFSQSKFIVRFGEDTSIGEVPKSQILMTHFSFKAPVGVMMEAYGSPVPAVEL